MKKIFLGLIFGLTFMANTSVFANSWSIGSNGSNLNINYSGGSSYGGVSAGSTDFDNAFNSVSEGSTLPGGEFELPGAEAYNTIGENTSIRDFIQKVLNFILSFLGLIAIIAIIYAGYMYIIAGGDDGNIEKAKKTIIYAVIGLIVVVISYALVNTILKEAITGGDDRLENGINGGSSNGGSFNSNNGGNFSEGGSTGGIKGGNYYSKNASVKTNYAPGTTLPAGTKLQNGAILTQDTVVREDGTVEAPATQIERDTTNDPNIEAVEKLLSFDNGIVVSGDGVNDIGGSIVISKESAAKGLDFGLSVQANALFDFGDGVQAPLDTITSPGGTINHSFGLEQTYLVRAIAQTADGQVQTFSKTIVVGGINADFRLSKSEVLVGELVDATALAKTSIGSIKSYNWSCDGGTGCFPNIQGESISASFGDSGNYTIVLDIENTLGAKTQISKNVTVSSNAPTASFTTESTNNEEKPMEFRFSALNSKNTEGGSEGLTYEWDLGGTTKTSNTSEITHEFSSEGPQVVTLKVIENTRGQTLESEVIEATIEVNSAINPDFNISQ